jgi:hypothetical protein
LTEGSGDLLRGAALVFANQKFGSEVVDKPRDAFLDRLFVLVREEFGRALKRGTRHTYGTSTETTD